MADARGDGFRAFFKRYTKTWQHALATAGLTAFGTLTFVDPLFAVLAVGTYVLTPVALYLRRSAPRTVDESDSEAGTTHGGSHRDSEPTPDDATTSTVSGGSGSRESDPGWRSVRVPADHDLHDVALLDGDAYAVGDAGTVLGSDGEDWDVVLPDGPGAASNALCGVATVTSDGVWVAGNSGALGRLDAASGRHVDHSAPDGDTTNLTDVAAVATSDGELVFVVDGSGRIRRGRYRDGEVRWADPVTPGSGSSMAGIAAIDSDAVVACDTNQQVFASEDGGATFHALGLDGAEGTLTGVAAVGVERCVACDDAGVVHRYDGTTWTPERVAEEALGAIDWSNGVLVVCGDDGSIFEREADVSGWHRESTPPSGPLAGIAHGSSRTVAVGGGSSAIERRR